MITPPPSRLSPLSILGLLARLLVGGVLIYSGFSKAIAPGAEFAAALANYKILSGSLILLIAQVWPWVELLVGTYVFFGFMTPLFSQVAAGMFGIFLLVLGSVVLRGIDLGSCGCFGRNINLTPQQTLGLDSLFFVCAIVSAWTSRKAAFLSADSWISK